MNEDLLIFRLTKEQRRRCFDREQWVLKHLSLHPLLAEKHTDGPRPQELLPCGTLAYRLVWGENKATLSVLTGSILVFCGTKEELHQLRPERVWNEYKKMASLFAHILWVFADDSEADDVGSNALIRANNARVTERIREYDEDWQKSWFLPPENAQAEIQK